ncbi:MAG: phosphatase PAP2 family protein [Bacteroidales bacterium]
MIPAAFVSYGIAAQLSACVRQWNRDIDHAVLKSAFHSELDNYIQYVPVAAVFGLDVCGVKAKHGAIDRLFITASACLLSTATVQTVKHTVRVWRPDGSAPNSFPSGHTAMAFVGAHILFKEYRDISPWIGTAGYAVATATGVMRILNRRHWLSDVVAGAGVGILCVEVSELLLPVFHRVTGLSAPPLAVAPMVGSRYFGIGLAYTF